MVSGIFLLRCLRSIICGFDWVGYFRHLNLRVERSILYLPAPSLIISGLWLKRFTRSISYLPGCLMFIASMSRATASSFVLVFSLFEIISLTSLSISFSWVLVSFLTVSSAFLRLSSFM